MAVTIGGSPINSTQAEELRAALGIPEPEVIDTPLTDLVGTDQIVAFRGGEPYTTTMNDVAVYMADVLELDPPAATAPAAFTAGQWTATAGDTEIAVNITALPADGGSAITALEYRLDGGTAVAFTGTGTGSRDITGLTNDTEYDIEIRAVNAVGNGDWSDLKARTPVAAVAGGDMSIVQAPAPTLQAFGTTVQRTLTAVGTDNPITVCVVATTDSGAPTITDSASGTWGSPAFSFVGADGKTVRMYTRPAATGVTWVQATFAGAASAWISAVEVDLPGESLVIADSEDASQTGSISYQFPVTTTEANALFMGGAFLLNDGGTFEGVGSIEAYDSDSGYGFYAVGTIASAGAATPEVTLTLDPPGEKFWVVWQPAP